MRGWGLWKYIHFYTHLYVVGGWVGSFIYFGVVGYGRGDTPVREMKTLKENPSKAEEVAFFESLMNTIPRESYLAHLFTPALRLYVVEAIEKDFRPDIAGELEETKKALEGIEADLISARQDQERGRDNLKVVFEGREEARRMVTHLQEECGKFQQARNHEAHRVEVLEAELTEAKKEAGRVKVMEEALEAMARLPPHLTHIPAATSSPHPQGERDYIPERDRDEEERSLLLGGGS